MSVAELHAAPVVERASRKRGTWPWFLAGGAFMILIAPVVLFAGAGNPPCETSPTIVSGTGGPAPAGMFAQPLQLQPDRWYRVGATEYGGPNDPTSSAWGSSGAYLPAEPNSFAELSVLDTNPANTGTFTFQDANALDNLPYGTALRVAAGGSERVLYKRDTGYGQGPGQAIPYRLDVWWQSGLDRARTEIGDRRAARTAASRGRDGIDSRQREQLPGQRKRPVAADARPAGADSAEWAGGRT
jgi:hypothetical protein